MRSIIGGYPAGTDRVYNPSRLTRGDLIVWDDQIWRVLGIDERDHEDRPLIIQIRPAGESLDSTAADNDLHLAASRYATFDRYLDSDHLPVCAVCGGPWPCRHLKADALADREIKRAERFSIPNVCPACGEPVTQRQLRQTWPVNLYALDRDQPVTFHLRLRCERDAIAYDHAVMKAGMPSQLGYKDLP